jgi:t-SNARE complex subunit (syntaxin)
MQHISQLLDQFCKDNNTLELRPKTIIKDEFFEQIQMTTQQLEQRRQKILKEFEKPKLIDQNYLRKNKFNIIREFNKLTN